MGFGNALADILKKMHEGVRGLRIGNVSQLTPMPFRNPYVCVYIYMYIIYFYIFTSRETSYTCMYTEGKLYYAHHARFRSFSTYTSI